MTENLTDDEQMQALKKWWRDNGRFTILLVVICIAGYFGWQLWKNHQQQQAESAALLYEDLLEAVTTTPGEALTEEKRKTADYIISQLRTDHSTSFYTINAAMYGAKIAVEENDLGKATELLQWALDRNHSDEIDNLLRLRLARVMNASMNYDQALALSQYDGTDEFMSLFAAVRGDAYLGKDDISAAKAEYQLALINLSSSQSQWQTLLEMKIADLAVSDGEEPSAQNGKPSAQNGKPSAQNKLSEEYEKSAAPIKVTTIKGVNE